MELVLLGLGVGDLGQPELDGGGELGVLGLEAGEVGVEDGVLLLYEGAGLLGGDGGGIGLGTDGVELAAGVADEGVRALSNRRSVVGDEAELVVGDEQRHRASTEKYLGFGNRRKGMEIAK